MNDQTTTKKRLICPLCGSQGKRVGTLTIRAQLKDEFVDSTMGDNQACGRPGEGCAPRNDDTGWRYCDSPDCDIVYFSEDDGTTIAKSQLQVAVGVKEKSGERPLCYCFGHSVASIKEELRTKGRSEALEDIRTKMKHPGCHCETSNPSGSCCLGSVSKGLRIAQEELGMTDSNLMPTTPATTSTNRGEGIVKIGTIVSAIMASACCWLPLLLLAVGVSGVGIAATLEAYRPAFIVVTFGFLGAAFYFTYRPKRAAAEAGHSCCASEAAEGEGCRTPSSNGRLDMMTMNKITLWVVTVLAVAFLFFPSYVGLLLGTGNGAAVTEKMNRAVFEIQGMTCEGCATAVAQAIRQVPGVVAVDVSYEERQAVVGADAGGAVPTEEILAALKQAGYRGKLVALKHPPQLSEKQ
jgi:copper chaperone CopZ